MKIETILDQIDLGVMALPEFQRGYVWNRDQARGLIDSLYRKHPVGGLLVWVTKTDSTATRGDGPPRSGGTVELLLDGQQRITSLYGIINGRPPRFFEGNAQAFTGLYFNLDTETFEFYAPQKMKDNPVWISVTDLMRVGPGDFIQRLLTMPDLAANLSAYVNRLTAINGIKDIELHIERVTGDDKTVDVVVDIFNRVNSGGTKLSKGDLALAKICAEWPEARRELNDRLEKWQKAGYSFRLEWLLRNINTIITGEALFSAFANVDTMAFQKGLQQAERSVDYLLNQISGRLGLDHDRVLGGRFAFPVLSRYLALRGGRFQNAMERDKALYWYVHSFLWGRYAATVEGTINQDLRVIDGTVDSVDRLIEQLRRWRGDLLVRPEDFSGWGLGARFYPLLYLLTRVQHAQDWEDGVALSAHLLGKLNTLQVHHIFPKALLYRHGYTKSEANALANFTYLTQDTNLKVSARDPQEYLAEYAEKHPGTVESHWIPMDRDLWKTENYLRFLAARRELLAKAANQFLDSLLVGAVPETATPIDVLAQPSGEAPVALPASVATEDEDQLLQRVNEWVIRQGLPAGEYPHEVVDPLTGAQIAILDLAWPNGLQEELSLPVALLIDETAEVEAVASQAGFLFFTNVDDFTRYVRQDILAIHEEQAAD